MTARGNYRHFQRNLAKYIRENPGKYVLIANGKEQGFYDTFDLAYCTAIKVYKLGCFVIQECSDEPILSTVYYSGQRR